MKPALVVVDVQNGVLAEGQYESSKVLDNIIILQNWAKEQGIETIYFRHIEPHDKSFNEAAFGSQITDIIAPKHDEKVFLKYYNSIFKETGFETYLNEREIDTLIIVGFVTEYCIDTSVRVAFEKGYKVFIPEMTNSTSDTIVSAKQKYELFNYYIFKDRFAIVDTIENVMLNIEKEIVDGKSD